MATWDSAVVGLHSLLPSESLAVLLVDAVVTAFGSRPDNGFSSTARLTEPGAAWSVFIRWCSKNSSRVSLGNRDRVHVQDTECDMPAPQLTQGQQLADDSRQHNPATRQESRQCKIVSLPQLPLQPAGHSPARHHAPHRHDKCDLHQESFCEGGALEFRDISYWLPPSRASWRERLSQARSIAQHSSSGSGIAPDAGQPRRKRRGKQLLVAISGAAQPGRLLAVMGPSGEHESRTPAWQPACPVMHDHLQGLFDYQLPSATQLRTTHTQQAAADANTLT